VVSSGFGFVKLCRYAISGRVAMRILDLSGCRRPVAMGAEILTRRRPGWSLRIAQELEKHTKNNSRCDVSGWHV
jgi:hypothetical protein